MSDASSNDLLERLDFIVHYVTVLKEDEIDTIVKAKAEIERLRDKVDTAKSAYSDLLLRAVEIEQLRATIDDVQKLPVKWLSEGVVAGVGMPKDGEALQRCAYELQAVLEANDE